MCISDYYNVANQKWLKSRILHIFLSFFILLSLASLAPQYHKCCIQNQPSCSSWQILWGWSSELSSAFEKIQLANAKASDFLMHIDVFHSTISHGSTLLMYSMCPCKHSIYVILSPKPASLLLSQLLTLICL